MARRFVNLRPMELFMIKVRWLVTGLITVIVVLSCSLVYVGLTPVNETKNSNVHGPTAATAYALQPKIVRLLVARRRIEVGAQLSSEFFTERLFREEEAPASALTIADLPRIRGAYARYMISPDTPLLSDATTNERPFSPLSIPAGFRAVTISLDLREIGDGFIVPDSRVDVIWRFKDRNGETQLATIVPFCKVLSVRGTTQAEGRVSVESSGNTVTLLVSEMDAARIEYARSEGSLSLLLRGTNDAGIRDVPVPIIIKRSGVLPHEVEDPIPEATARWETATGLKQCFQVVKGKVRQCD